MTTQAHPDSTAAAQPETAPAEFGTSQVINPFKRGQSVLIPAGTPIQTTISKGQGRKTSGRNHTIIARFVHNGSVDVRDDLGEGHGYVVLPEVTWAGTAGYWHTVRVTPELCAANGFPSPFLPDSTTIGGYDASLLDVEPSYGTGYDNRYSWSI